VVRIAQKIAPSRASVMLSGESGSGKDVLARYIHEISDRRAGPFVAINCSAIPKDLMESELFGHSRGAFTGAVEKKMGQFEEVSGGTLFLDEIADLHPSLQAKLLRVLQEGKIKRVGENQFRPINIRLICATHKDLKKEVCEGRFRDDLFFRINVVPIEIPALRDRKVDIVPLSEHFLRKHVRLNHLKVLGFTESALKALVEYSWPGNIRELENLIERSCLLCENDWVTEEDLGIEANRLHGFDRTENFSKVGSNGEIAPLAEIEMNYINHVLDLNNGCREKTASQLGIDRKTLYRRLLSSHATH